MLRYLLTAFGGLLIGLAAWGLIGMAAAMIFSKTGAGAHDGGGAMGGFFVIGGMGGIVGAIAGAILVWRLLADSARLGSVAGGLGGLLVVLIGVLIYTMTPKHVEFSNFPADRRGEFQVEANFPSARIGALGKQDALSFQLRGGGFFLEVPWQRAQIRQEGDHAVVPAAFKVNTVSQWILAIMQGEKQLDTTTVGIDRFNDILNQTTEWSAWTPTDSGLSVRWRFAVLPR